MKGEVSKLINERYGVFIIGAQGRIMISHHETRAEADKVAENIPPRSHFIVRRDAGDRSTVTEVRIGEYGRKLTTTHECQSSGELHRLRIKLMDQGLYEAKPQ